MTLDVEKLKQLKNSDDFEYVRSTLINLKKSFNMNNESFMSGYETYIRKFMHYRLFMKTQYICDTTMREIDPEKSLLQHIIQMTIDKILRYFEGRYSNINEVDMTDNCVAISLEVEAICKRIGVECETVRLYPGYDEKAKLFGRNGYHYFNIITINGKKYLVDLSYKQFFKKNINFLEEIGVPCLCAPTAGIFMMLDERRKKVAEEILQNAFIELKGDTLKLYCDGFTMSYRNGLYYKYFGNDYSTEYTTEDYIRFLNGEDSQLKHEPIICLGMMKIYKK